MAYAPAAAIRRPQIKVMSLTKQQLEKPHRCRQSSLLHIIISPLNARVRAFIKHGISASALPKMTSLDFDVCLCSTKCIESLA